MLSFPHLVIFPKESSVQDNKTGKLSKLGLSHTIAGRRTGLTEYNNRIPPLRIYMCFYPQFLPVLAIPRPVREGTGLCISWGLRSGW